MSAHITHRLGIKRSIDFFRPGTSPQDGTTPDDTWPPESLDIPHDSSRRPSLPQSDEPLSTRFSYGRPSRPSSAGNGAERPHHHHSRRLGSKYSLLNLFRKSSTEMLSTHSTPGGATPDVIIGPGTSNTASSPTSPLSSSPSTFALELGSLGQDSSPPAPSSMLRSNGVSSESSPAVQSVSISASQHPQSSRTLRFNSSEPNVSSRGKSPRRAPLGSSPGHDGRLSEESEDEDEEYGIEAVRSRMMSGDASTQDIGFPFSIDVPVEDELPGLSDVRGRGDSLSTNLSATTASTASLRTPSALPAILPSASEDVKHFPHGHRPPPLTGLATSNISTRAEAEALVAHARGQVLTAREGDDIPLSARLAVLGESLRLERKFKEAKQSLTPGSPIERRASEGTALDTADAEPWEQDLSNGKTRSASASAGAGASFARRPTSGMGPLAAERNFSPDYRVGHSWRGRSRRPITNESALSSDDGKFIHSISLLMRCAHFRRPPGSSS